jgi:hypothetical protein
MIGGYMINVVSCMMFLEKERAMINVPREHKRQFSFKNKDNELMEDYIHASIMKFVILDMEKIEEIKREDN